MRQHRFYHPESIDSTAPFPLAKEAAHHCINVLRYQPGQLLTVFNGDGFDYQCLIEQVDKKRCFVSLQSKTSNQTESPLKIHLYQGVARGDKMDWIIQKCVELGVAEITPVFTERCNVKLDAKRLAKKQAHWQAVAISACEQSGRAYIPPIHPLAKLTELNLPSGNQAFYLHPDSEHTFNGLSASKQVALFIGPEGGFSDTDRHCLTSLNVTALRLGPRILRTETAGLTSIAILQANLGDLAR